MATQSSSTATGVGSSSAPTILEILTTTRNPDVWQHFNLCKMSDNSTKAQCKHCFGFLSSGSNSTLRNHINHPHYEALKMVSKQGQSSMARDGSVFVFNPDVLLVLGFRLAADAAAVTGVKASAAADGGGGAGVLVVAVDDGSGGGAVVGVAAEWRGRVGCGGAGGEVIERRQRGDDGGGVMVGCGGEAAGGGGGAWRGVM
ncbi:zinc finger, BED-type, phospholipase-like, homeodomain-like protein [Tanacetum coccineum]